MHLPGSFIAAAKDYFFLLEHQYPQKAVLKLVGDRYALTAVQRTMLYRGITTRVNAELRKSKLMAGSYVHHSSLHIDGYNVLITIGSYLNGNTMFIGNDHFLRDAAESHGKAVRSALLVRSLALLFEVLKQEKVNEAFFYFDKPVSKSGILSNKVNKLLSEYAIPGSTETFDSPDHQLKQLMEGCCATSDSTIIDHSQIPVLDLARYVLEWHYSPEFIELHSIIEK